MLNRFKIKIHLVCELFRHVMFASEIYIYTSESNRETDSDREEDREREVKVSFIKLDHLIGLIETWKFGKSVFPSYTLMMMMCFFFPSGASKK